MGWSEVEFLTEVSFRRRGQQLQLEFGARGKKKEGEEGREWRHKGRSD
jgi:hypothetical protein